jgi:hypothetical protein
MNAPKCHGPRRPIKSRKGIVTGLISKSKIKASFQGQIKTVEMGCDIEHEERGSASQGRKHGEPM